MKKISEMPKEMRRLFKIIKYYVDETDYQIEYIVVDTPNEVTEPLTVELFIQTDPKTLLNKYGDYAGDRLKFNLSDATDEKIDILSEAFMMEVVNGSVRRFPNLEHLEE